VTAREPVTLLRISDSEATVYAVVRASESVRVMAGMLASGGPDDVDTTGWETLPGTEEAAARMLAGMVADLAVIGVAPACGGTWSAWNLPGTPPPVPGGAA